MTYHFINLGLISEFLYTLPPQTHTQTVRVVDGETFELLRTVNTTDILGWHTLTYLAFNPAEVNIITDRTN